VPVGDGIGLGSVHDARVVSSVHPGCNQRNLTI
jgi:hypothetical protein